MSPKSVRSSRWRRCGEQRSFPVDEYLALEAADFSLDHGLAMADSLIYVTARRESADLVTADADFDGLPGVVLIR